MPRRAGKQPTIGDVAREAGVGVGTVSRVLNGGDRVRPETRLRVLAVIDELEYHPSPAAQSLRRGRTNTVSVIAPFATRASGVERLRGVVSALRPSGYELMLYDVETPEQRRARFDDVARGGRSDGTIVVSLPLRPKEAEVFERAGVPVVLLDREHRGFSSVAVDDVRGGYMAAKHLIDLGHEKIAFLGDVRRTPFGFTSSARRLEGFRKALAEAKLKLPPALVKEGPHGRHVAHRLTAELLEGRIVPTALFAASDTQALGVLESADGAGVSVPGELSVIGFDDVEVSAYVGLTTVRQPLFESGRRAVELLLAELEDGSVGAARERLPLELVVRRTTAPAPR
jgi:LacI family transcriptional regulator